MTKFSLQTITQNRTVKVHHPEHVPPINPPPNFQMGDDGAQLETDFPSRRLLCGPDCG